MKGCGKVKTRDLIGTREAPFSCRRRFPFFDEDISNGWRKRHEKKTSRKGMFLSSKMSKDDSPGNPSSATAEMSSRNYQGRVGESSEFSIK